MAHHGVLCRRLLAVAFLQHLILQTAGQRDDAFLLGVLGQILLTGLLVHLALFCTLCIDFLFLLGEVLLHNLLCLTVLHLQFVACNDILDGSGKIVNVQFAGTHLGQLLAYAQT